MDFLDPKKRKAHRIRLYIGYGLMAVALAFATTVLLYQAYGYDYDPKTGEIVQNGFVFVDSTPVKANILLNGNNRGQTDTRIDTAAGDYSVELQADGYRTWHQNFTLEGGKIERLTYPFLFPTTVVSKDVQLYAAAPSFVSQSPDHRWLLSGQPGAFQSFDLMDDNVDAPTASSLSLPTGLLKATGANHKVTVVEWSTDNRHVLMRHDFDGGFEFFLFDIESPGATVNLSTQLNTKALISLRDKKFDLYYVHDPASQVLSTAELRSQTLVPYLTGVLNFQPHGGDIVLFVTATGASEGKVWLKAREGNDTYNLREVPIGDSYLLDVARYENNWYYAGGSNKDQKVYVFKNPVAASKREPDQLPVPTAALRSSTLPQFVSFSENARFIAVQSGREFAVYDAETDRQYRYNADIEVADSYQALWMDGHRLSVVSKDKVVAFDFDGMNRQELTAGSAGAQVYFNEGWRNMFVLAPSQSVSGRLAITSTSLRVAP